MYAERMDKLIDDIPSETMEAMAAYNWPGNVRELQNFVEHGVIVSHGPIFQPALDQLRAEAQVAPMKGSRTLEDATRDHILETLQRANWVVGGRQGAAARLGIARTTLLSKMRRLGIETMPGEISSKRAHSRQEFASAG